ncbi:MAG: TonB-dependent receptor [Bacteroidota bacterium]
MKIKSILSSLLAMTFLMLLHSVSAQTATVKGKVIDPLNKPIDNVLVKALGTDFSSRSSTNGAYSITLPANNQLYKIEFSHPSFQTTILEIRLVAGRTYDEPIKMLDRSLEEVQILGQQDPTSIQGREGMMVMPISIEQIPEMPLVTSLEAAVKGMPGVATNNEFSSQYQVRGGNFDENLVYVNGIEIYRPFLARSGQQEGLGFSNPNLAQGLQFSSGGFAAQYGDKMSSVLDITYKDPKEFKATAEIGIITNNIHMEGRSKNKKEPDQPGRFTYLMGARRFSASYLLNSLETRGDYRPNFLDYQGMFTYTPKTRAKLPKYKINSEGDTVDVKYYKENTLKLTAFFAVSRNRYEFEPTGRETTFGTIQQAFRLRVAFEGREISTYTTGLGALMVSHRPSTRLNFDYIVTAFQTQESELFDLEGGYLLGEVNTNFGSDEFGESEFDLGIGSEFRHARNYLTANVLSAQMKGRWTSDNRSTHRILFGLKYQYQQFDDNLKEYSVLDSAGYLVDTLGRFGLVETIRGQIQLSSALYKSYLQYEWQMHRNVLFTAGARLVYYDLLDKVMFSPRAQLLISAFKGQQGDPYLRFRLAGGVYQQPPFYRELRRFDGSLNLDIEPQQSVHAIVGMEYQFEAWGRPFLLTSDAYYKRLSNLIPYEVQNVRIRYYPDEVADGYAYGFDARINGEFIKGVDSWVSFGLLKTEEDIRGDDRGYVPRPTDQRFTFAMYFQDEMPINPTYKVHVNYVYGSGMRFGPPATFESRTAYDFPAYHRVDIGFSKEFRFNRPKDAPTYGLESLWATIEFFNLLQRENTVSHVWIKDLQNNSFAVPNHLSARLINARIILKIR